jgi:hypothetical protein
MTFLGDVFFKGIQVAGAFLDAFVTNVFVMLVVCGALFYLLLLLLLLSRIYRSDRSRELVDADERIKLCAIWADIAVAITLLGTVGWMYYRAALPLQSSLLQYLRPLAAHGALLCLLFIVWLGLYLSIRGDSKAAQRMLP